jgi:hypothetical protein
MQIEIYALTLVATLVAPALTAAQGVEYKVVATNKTSTLQKEMTEAAEAGYRFVGVMGGDTAFGGKEVVTLMQKTSGGAGRFSYKLLATSKTSTMQKELQEAGEAGFEYVGQTVFESLFGGKEVTVILERDKEAKGTAKYDYKLIATSKTSTLQKELAALGSAGYQALGLTVAETAMGGAELVVITRRAVH